MRPLTFSDDQGHEQRWLPDGPEPAVDAFAEFVDQHRGADNLTFSVEDDEGALVLLFGFGFIGRVREQQVEYRLVRSSGDYLKLAQDFVRDGFRALDLRGPWYPDLAGVVRARLRSEFDGSVLRRTHPRELRHRLEVLTRADGREPTTVAGATHLGFTAGDGDTVNAWFTAHGRGLLVTSDHTSPLATGDGRAQAALYDGVPADLLTLVRDVPESATIRTVRHPDGGTLVAATGVFTFSGPCAMAEGLVSRLQEEQLDVEDTGVDRLLGGVLSLADLTPAAVAGATGWWSAEDLARALAATGTAGGEQAPTAPLDRAALERFCQIWADSGYNDRWDVHYVLFDSLTLEEAGETREELLQLVQILGLERVEAPPGAASGEVWVRTDPRVDAELGSWS